MADRVQQVPSVDLSLARRQLAAIDAFNEARVRSSLALATAARSRETRMDAGRRLEVLRREQDAVVSRAHEQLRQSGDLLRHPVVLRAVVAHRSSWFAGKIIERLTQADVQVVGVVDNGADAVGFAIAEQPDLLFLEEALLMVTGEEVIREAKRFCPRTRIGAQAEYGDRAAVLLDAGADTVATRQMPPVEVAEQLLALLGDPSGAESYRDN